MRARSIFVSDIRTDTMRLIGDELHSPAINGTQPHRLTL